jgi:hypothetical protein
MLIRAVIRSAIPLFRFFLNWLLARKLPEDVTWSCVAPPHHHREAISNMRPSPAPDPPLRGRLQRYVVFNHE